MKPCNLSEAEIIVNTENPYGTWKVEATHLEQSGERTITFKNADPLYAHLPETVLPEKMLEEWGCKGFKY